MSGPRLGAWQRLHLGAVDVAAGLARRVRGTEQLPRPVISVGNLAFGGTGKTPFTLWLARALSREGYLICILSRGYRGLRRDDPLLVSDLRRIQAGPVEAGDEAFLLARKLPGVPVVVGADRAAAGRLALERFPVHFFLLDDGFQHHRLDRKADFVLLDALQPWDRLREGPAALSRADCVIATRAHRAGEGAIERLRAEVAELSPNASFLTARTSPSGFRRLSAAHADLPGLEGAKVFAFCGLARPEAFFEDVRATGLEVVGRRHFPDHHPYTRHDLQRLLNEAEEAGASTLVTTEKDGVRLPLPRAHEFPPVYALKHRLEIDDVGLLGRELQRLLPEPRTGGRG